MEDQETYVRTPPLTLNGQSTGQVVTRLSALDRLFDANGIAVLKVRRGPQEHTIEIPIQSVDQELVEALVKPYRPKLPRKRDQVNGKWVDVIDEAAPEYQERMAVFNRVSLYVLVLLGLAVDVVDKQGQVVWAADNSVHELEPARQALREMGFVDEHLLTLIRAIRELTTFEEETQGRD